MVENLNRPRAKEADPDLLKLEKQALASLETALSQIRMLSDARLRAKLSVSRVTGAARELRELIKVLSSYGC